MRGRKAFSQPSRLEVLQQRPDRRLLFLVHLMRSRCVRRISDRLLALDGRQGSLRRRRRGLELPYRRMCRRWLRGFPARRQRPRLPAFEDAAADFHARIVRGVKKERHALLDDRVRSRKRLSEGFVEMGRGRRSEVDCEHRRIFIPKELQKLLGPIPVPCAFTSPLRRSVGRPSSSTRPRNRSACMS